MKSFAGELQIEFKIELENSHVIKPEQVCLAAMPRGIMNTEFVFNFSNKGNTKMQEDLGRSILSIVEKAPDGMLIFFASYQMMDKMYELWEDHGIIDQMERVKSVYKEPKQSSRFKAIRSNFENDVNKGRGAILMGVCRGKISEGLDFSDRAARSVIVVGMPFAQWKDPKVQ